MKDPLKVLLVQQRKISANFIKGYTKFCLSLHYNGDKSYVYLNKTKICKFKGSHNICWYNFGLGSTSKNFTKDDQSENSLSGTVHDFSVHHSSSTKEDILNIDQYLMVKNEIKQCFIGLLTGIVNVFNHTKYVLLNNQQSMTERTLINLYIVIYM